MNGQSNHTFQFGPFELDADEHVLRRDGQPLALTPKAVETLFVLVEGRGRIVEKRELLDRVWPNTFVEEGTLVQNIFTLRKALANGAEGQVYIETVPRRGYRFAANVMESRSHQQDERGAGQEVKGAAAEKLNGGRNRHTQRSMAVTVLVVSGLAVMAAVLILFLRSNHGALATASNASPRSLAVLPFKSIGSTDVDEYLGLGMADALIVRLAATKQIKVRPTNSVRKYNEPGQDPLRARRALQPDSLLDGNFQISGDRIRVTVQLLNVSDGKALWSGTFDNYIKDIFTVQDSISTQVASSIGVTLMARDAPNHYASNSEAYQAYLKGRYFWAKRTGESRERAIQYFDDAIRIDPSYALAYSGRAEARIGRWTVADFRMAKADALNAVKLDPALAEGFVSKGVAELHLAEWAECRQSLARAIELDPNNANAHLWMGCYLRAIGQLEDAVDEARRSVELDPLSVVNNLTYGVTLYAAHNYDEALRQYQNALEIDGSDYWARLRVAELYTMMGRYNDAFAEYQRMLGAAGGGGAALYRLAYAWAAGGRAEQARRIIDEYRGGPSYDVALVCVALREYNRAFDLLTRLLDSGDGNLIVNLKTDPKLDPIRTDPRFQQLISRLGLA